LSSSSIVIKSEILSFSSVEYFFVDESRFVRLNAIPFVVSISSDSSSIGERIVAE
jgi:hypothetical protein